MKIETLLGVSCLFLIMIFVSTGIDFNLTTISVLIILLYFSYRFFLKGLYYKISWSFGWEFVGKGTADYRGGKLGISDNFVPNWLKRFRFSFSEGISYVKGSNFRYKIIMTRPGEQGSPFLYELYKRKRKSSKK